ncbi:monovalent cation/H+ antiporter complex subunit F [Litorivicinus lipolyticus]|jgi:multicomponent Na+:H+ antiporter subunit F|uniref:monovalent cation/H+ antiporter complex subunit F n=1 Tax=Litorivicinus lipolyticus TaxID=418701 RepID=UPI003B58C6D2
MNIFSTALTGFVGFASVAAALMVLLALVLTAVRLLRGPSLADRVVALDLISMLLVAFLVIFATSSALESYLDAGLALALVAFLSTVAFARFIERSGHIEDDA